MEIVQYCSEIMTTITPWHHSHWVLKPESPDLARQILLYCQRPETEKWPGTNLKPAPTPSSDLLEIIQPRLDWFEKLGLTPAIFLCVFYFAFCVLNF
jgi:hypothetical protein